MKEFLETMKIIMNLINFKAKMEQRKKPLVVYFHRYSIEYESVRINVV